MAEQVKEIGSCGSCPFVQTVEDGWECDAGHDFESGAAWDGYPRPLAVIHGQSPPEWCRLRTGPVTIRLAPKTIDKDIETR